GLVTLRTSAGSLLDGDAGELLTSLQVSFDYEELTGPPYADDELNHLLMQYAHTLRSSYVLFPSVALECLQRMSAWSDQGMVLLAADKGDHRLETLQGRPPADVTLQGAVSLEVNFHALKMFCELRGGISIFPAEHSQLDVCCLLMVPNAERY